MRGRTLVVCRRVFTDHRQGDVKPLTIVVLYTDLLFQLPPTLTISSATQVRGSDSIGYEVCGYAAKDHSNLNEGEGKEICYLSGIG